MKTFLSIFSFAVLTCLIFISCSSDDDSTINDDTNNSPCSNYNKNLLALNTVFDNNVNAVIDYNSFLINDLDSSTPIFEGSLTTNTNLTYQLPTSTSLYSDNSKLHGMLVTRAGKYFTFNTNTGTGQEFTAPSNIAAPIIVDGESYVIEVSNSGYANSGTDNHFSVKPFNMNDGTTSTALTIPAINTTFNNNSFFHVESMSAASNGVNELYFVSGTNLITVNVSNNTSSHVDLYPSFSNTDFVRFIGLEYSESFGLLAIMDMPDINSRKIVKIDPTNGTYSDLLSIPTNINTEFYSTVYSECNKTYYLTSLANGNTVQTNYFEFDLVANTISNTQVFNDYVFGIELID